MNAHNANPTSMSVPQNNFHDMEAPHKTAIGGDMPELGAVSQSAHQAIANQLSQLAPDEVWLVSPEFACGKTWLYLKKITWRKFFQYILYKFKASFLRHIMRKR